MSGRFENKDNLYYINLEKILFLDVETVPMCFEFKDLPDKFKPLWQKKMKTISKQEEKTPEELYFEKAGIYAEFGKIVCISVGFFRILDDNTKTFRVKSFSNDDEKVILEEFKCLLENHFNSEDNLLCGHNGKEFDFPYISRRMLVNGILLPDMLNNFAKKPWQTKFIDTMELWKFGDYKNYTSLNLLAAVFDIPTPKDDISGEDVAEVYWKENNLPRIAHYCNKDVITTARLFLKFRGEETLSDDNIIVAE